MAVLRPAQGGGVPAGPVAAPILLVTLDVALKSGFPRPTYITPPPPPTLSLPRLVPQHQPPLPAPEGPLLNLPHSNVRPFPLPSPLLFPAITPHRALTRLLGSAAIRCGEGDSGPEHGLVQRRPRVHRLDLLRPAERHGTQ